MCIVRGMLLACVLSASFLCGLGSAFAESVSDPETAAIEKRIAPIGKVSVAGVHKKKPEPSKAPVQTAPLSGEALYQRTCSTCHAVGLAGAPKVQSSDWDERLKKGVDGLLESAKTGLNAMPPRGTCVECTDEQLKSAIEYMLPKK